MRAVIIANHGDSDDGFVGERLRDLGVTTDFVSRDAPGYLADADERADLVVLLGSDWSVYDPLHADCVQAETELIQRALVSGLPVFAICYGAQLAAQSLGMAVRRSENPEIGWVQIESFNEHLSPSAPWFELHFDRWEHRADIPLLAKSEVAPQGFQFGRLLAVQFHPEVRPEVAMQWVRGRDHIDIEHIDLGELEAQTFDLAPAARLACHRLVDAFLNEVAGSDMSLAAGKANQPA